LDIERRADSIACEQPESSLATFFRQFFLNLFPAVKFAGIRQKNSPSIYFESSPAHHTPLHNNRWFGIGSWRSSKSHLEPRRMSINVWRMSKAYMAIQRQCSRPLQFSTIPFFFEGLNFDCTASALLLGPDSLQTPSESVGLASHGCSARQICAHHRRATPRRLQICPPPACCQWPKQVENEAPDAKV